MTKNQDPHNAENGAVDEGPASAESYAPRRLERLAEAPLPTAFGLFKIVVFRYPDPKAHPDLSQEHLAMVMGEVEGEENVPLRVHSECLTGEVFSSLKCDCKQQLEAAQKHVAQAGRGVILYLRQEGRGIGLANKVKAYALQAEGADTIEANERLHLPVDARQYDVAAEMIQALGIRSIQLLTNNPEKQESLARLGILVKGRVPVYVAPTEYSEDYLRVKRDRMRHLLPPQLTAAKH